MDIKASLKNAMGKETVFAWSVLRPCYFAFIRSKLVFFFRFKTYLDDEKYIRWLYKKRFGIEADLSNPKNFNEKNNWRKLHDRRDIYTEMVDKYRIKDIVLQRCGVEHTFPLLGVWDTPQDIDFEKLPDKFVLKVNHAGGVIVCRDKKIFDKKAAIRELTRTQKDNYYARSRECPYKNVERKIIAEQYMGENLTDYKNYCFGGKLKYTLVWKNTSRKDGRKPLASFCGSYDTDWVKTDMEVAYPSIDETIKKPDCYDQMREIVEKMSQDIPFVRVDCYIIDDIVYVGEMTFFPWGGFMKFKNEKWNWKFGELEVLPE